MDREGKDFLKYIKFEVDPDNAKLLNIQKNLEDNGISKKNIFILTKNLSESQKQKLETLYKEQIETIENNIACYKDRIISIKNTL